MSDRATTEDCVLLYSNFFFLKVYNMYDKSEKCPSSDSKSKVIK